MKRAWVLGVLVGLAGCASSPEVVSEVPVEPQGADVVEVGQEGSGEEADDAAAPEAGGAEALVEALEAFLVGHFDSSAQAQVEEGYHHISLKMCRVEAPELGAHVLYVEQAVATRLEAPYRQRLYRLSAAGGDVVESAIYTLADEASLLGACDRAELKVLQPGSYARKDGCEVMMRREGDRFVGSTQEGKCPSALRGASYATARVTVHAEGVDSWDQGFDAAGQQVWGAEAGPYRFRKVQASP